MSDRCPSDFVLEQFWLDGKSREGVEPHVSSCQQCQTRIASWEEARRQFLQKYPFEDFWREAVSEQGFLQKIWQWISAPRPAWQASLAVASLACLMVVILWPRQELPIILSKGGIEFGYYVSHGKEMRQGKKEMGLVPNDELRFFYSTEKENYLLLVGVEADESLSVYFPFGGDKSLIIQKGKKIFLPETIRWVPRTSYERFYALFTENSLSVGDIKEAITKALAQGEEPRSLEKLPLSGVQSTFILYHELDK